MNSYFKLTWMQIKLFSREPVALFFTLVFPMLLLLLFGAIFGNEPDPFYGGYGYIDAQVPGLTAIIIGTIGLTSIPVATSSARELKVLRRYKATPMRPLVYLAADITHQTLVGLLGMIILIITAFLVFDLRFGGNWFLVFLGFLLSILSFSAVGYLIAGLSPTGRIAQVVGQALYLPMMFLSGATMPLNIMGDGLRSFSSLLPLTHVVKMLQDLWFGVGWNGTAVSILTIMMVVGTVASTYTFRWE